MDNLRDTPGAVAAGCRHVVQPRWVHPRVAGHCCDTGRHAVDSGATGALDPAIGYWLWGYI